MSPFLPFFFLSRRASLNGDVTMRTDERTSEYRATQSMDTHIYPILPVVAAMPISHSHTKKTMISGWIPCRKVFARYRVTCVEVSADNFVACTATIWSPATHNNAGGHSISRRLCGLPLSEWRPGQGHWLLITCKVYRLKLSVFGIGTLATIYVDSMRREDGSQRTEEQQCKVVESRVGQLFKWRGYQQSSFEMYHKRKNKWHG